MNNLHNEHKDIKVLFGGSFNPPTIAHFMIAKKIIEKYQVAEFVFLPTGNIYSKNELIDSKYRIDMLNLLCKHLNKAIVSDFEASQTSYKGTAYTLDHFPGYYFIIGADNLIQITNWINFPKVVQKNKFIVLNRNNIDIKSFLNSEKMKELKDSFFIFDDFKEMPVSSTNYRKCFDKSIVLDEVYEYIRINKLYQ